MHTAVSPQLHWCHPVQRVIRLCDDHLWLMNAAQCQWVNYLSVVDCTSHQAAAVDWPLQQYTNAPRQPVLSRLITECAQFTKHLV